MGLTTVSCRSEYCGGSSTIPSSLRGSASSISVWTITLEGVWFDALAIAVSRCAFDWMSLGTDAWDVCIENGAGCVPDSVGGRVEGKGSTG